jgi:hypothetical protein
MFLARPRTTGTCGGRRTLTTPSCEWGRRAAGSAPSTPECPCLTFFLGLERFVGRLGTRRTFMDRSEPYLLEPGATRREGALLPFKACASDTHGALSVCEFTLGSWSTGPVLHVHHSVDEAYYETSTKPRSRMRTARSRAPRHRRPPRLGSRLIESAAGPAPYVPRRVEFGQLRGHMP